MLLATLITPVTVIAQSSNDNLSHERPDLEACLPTSGLSSISSIGEYKVGDAYCAVATASYGIDLTAKIFEFHSSGDAKNAFWDMYHSNGTTLISGTKYSSAAEGKVESTYQIFTFNHVYYYGVSGKYLVLTDDYVLGSTPDNTELPLFLSVNVPQQSTQIPLIPIVGVICAVIVVVAVVIGIRRR